MIEIEFNNKKIQFDRIVGYGCSFMAAAECLDHLINTDYSDLNTINALKRKYKFDGNSIYKHLSAKKYCDAGKVDEKYLWEPGTVNFPFLFEEQKRHSWLQRLADNFGVPCYNRAWSGGSMQSMQYFHEEDTVTGKIKHTDLIIVGVTSFVRWFYLSRSGEPMHPLFGYESHNWDKDMYGTFMENFSDNHPFLVMNAINAIRFFSNLPNPVIFVPSFTDFDKLREWHPLPPTSTVKLIYDHTMANISILPKSFNDVHNFDYGDPEAVKGFAGMHPTLEHQQQFGDLVYKELTGG